MSVGLYIYLIGFFATFGITIYIVQEKWKVGWIEIIGSFVLALFSWEGLLAIGIGHLLKRARRNNYFD